MSDHKLSRDDLRAGFWPDMTGGLCSRCHLDITRGDSEQPDPDHPECVEVWADESDGDPHAGCYQPHRGPDGYVDCDGRPI